MAQFWVGVASYSRSSFGAVGRAAYAAGERLEAAALGAYRSGDAVAGGGGKVHDFTRRSGVRETWLELPAGAPAWAMDRAGLWYAAERAETRRNASVAREVVASLPWEMSGEGRSAVGLAIGEYLCKRYGAAIDCAIHDPPKHGDERHHHAHFLMSTRVLGPDGFGAKTRELDAFATRRQEVEAIRAKVGELVNAQLEREGLDVRVDHRSYRRQASEVRAEQVREDRAAVDRQPTLSPAEKKIKLQARAAWRDEDRARRMAQDPAVQDLPTRRLVAEKEQQEVKAEVDARVQARIAELGRKLTRREVGVIRRAVEKRRRLAAKKRTTTRGLTREELARMKLAVVRENMAAAAAKPTRLAELEAQIRAHGHVVEAVAARLDGGLAVDRGRDVNRMIAALRAKVDRHVEQGLGR